MSGDELHAPLGYGKARAPTREALPWRMIGAGAAGAAIAGLAAFAILTDDGMGGEPFAIARIERRIKPPDTPAPAQVAAAAAPQAAAATVRPGGPSSMAGDVETENGVRVVRQGGGGAPGALIIHVPEEFGVHLTPAPDRRVVEKGRFGPLPKIGADGASPRDVYARPLITASGLKPGAPRIALVVGGMGLSQQATQGASAKLPGAVTLAFAPYGADLERQVSGVREGGHEVILQAPLEPFVVADSPGPHMLMADATPEQNIEHLHWLMSRFTGYVGLSGFLGAKFLASEAAMAPVLRETASRGLLWFDDGSASPGPAGSAAPGGSALRSDIVIDAVQKPEAIEAQLQKLEALARQKGGAIGFATGLPATVEQVARFARGLEKRGVALVPLSSFGAGVAVPAAGLGR